MQTFKQFITEKRSNPTKNEKSSFMDELRSIISKNGEGEYFVSFTEHNKIGVNPKSTFDTPLGIYFYPAEFVLNHKTTSNLPFAGERKYAQVVKAKPGSNIVDLSNMSEGDEQGWYDKIEKIFVDYMKKLKGYDKLSEGEKIVFNREYNGLCAAIAKNSHRNAKVSRLPGGRFWYVTMRIAEKMVGGQSDLIGSVREHPKRWNTLFRNLGINACVDHGNGVIHVNERDQAIFFDKSGFEQVDTIMNNISAALVKFSPELAEEFFKSNKIWNQQDIFNSFDVERDTTDEKTFNAILRFWWYAIQKSIEEKDSSGYFSRESLFVGSVIALGSDTPTVIKKLLSRSDVRTWLETDKGVNYDELMKRINQ